MPIGLSAEVLERVFERFYRGDEAHTTRGFGLGLPIAKRIVELSGGTIQIKSVVAEGTSVVIRLPRSHETPPSYKQMADASKQ
jgi:signal transduction histidine kinase